MPETPLELLISDDKQIDPLLRERFAIGETGLPYSPTYRLGNVVGLHYAAVGQSHFGSLIDIALCSFRFAVNAVSSGDESSKTTAETLLRILSPLFQRTPSGRVPEAGLCMLPKTVTEARYRVKYEELREFMKGCGVEMAQQIVAERPY